MNEKVKQILASIVDTFKSGKILDAVALASFPVPDIPSTRWSFMNRTIMFLSGTIDARGFRSPRGRPGSLRIDGPGGAGGNGGRIAGPAGRR